MDKNKQLKGDDKVMRYCICCGAQLFDDCKFCYKCGSEVKKIELNENPASSEIYNDQIECQAEVTNTISTNRFKDLYNKVADKLFLGGFLSAAFGIVVFLAIVLVGIIGWGQVYLYGGYDYTAVLTTISLIFMLLGFVVLSGVFTVNLKLKSVSKLARKKYSILSIVILILCVVLSAWGIVDYGNVQDRKSSYNDYFYGNSYNDYYTSGVDERLGLSLKVDNIKTSGNYTYVYCTVTNVSSNYVETRYRYVKVKALFMDSSGSIVDTDWTYAVDSTWLEPGESKTFEYMVRNTNIKSATLSFVD